MRGRAEVRVLKWGMIAFAMTLLLLVVLILRELYFPSRDRVEHTTHQAIAFSAEHIARGEYLAKIGNCEGCHTARGGDAYAGGRRVQTPFGAVVATNITPEKTHGIGHWSANDFYRALHEGRSRDGRLLSPAFPYTNTTIVSREDSDAIYAYLMNRVAPSSRANEPSSLSALYNSQVALAAWRVLFFRAETYATDPAKSAQWNRGAYLANGLAHCTACHGERNAFGAPKSSRGYAGAMMPLNDWYAPSMNRSDEASVAAWSNEDIVALLKHGINRQASVLGPMAEMVFKSTQHLSDDDAKAMATYLKSLPVANAPTSLATSTATPNTNAESRERGNQLYRTHCETCHGANGEGKLGAAPALAGNRAVTMANARNVIRVVLEGGFAPSTSGNPAPYGMPPFYHALKDAEIAGVLTHIRTSWGNAAAPVTALDMINYRNAIRTPQ
jgi:mono/diheme cytochrome c family protein